VATASIGFTGEAGATFVCSVDGGAYAACTAPKAFTGLAQGKHSLAVKVKDAAGNLSEPVIAEWEVFLTAPVAPTLTGAPTALTTSASASIAISGVTDAAFTCSFDSGAYVACTSPIAKSGLADGKHTLSVKQTDPFAHTGPAATVSWTVDTVGPSAKPGAATPVPAAFSKSPTATFTLPKATAPDVLQCQVDGGDWKPCSGSLPLTGLADGAHSLVTRFVDPAGNAGPTTSPVNWTVDTQAPVTPVAARGGTPDASTTLTSATFNVTGEQNATYECSLDGADPAPCTIPLALTDLDAGDHTMAIHQIDQAGNVSPDFTWNWTVVASDIDPGLEVDGPEISDPQPTDGQEKFGLIPLPNNQPGIGLKSLLRVYADPKKKTPVKQITYTITLVPRTGKTIGPLTVTAKNLVRKGKKGQFYTITVSGSTPAGKVFLLNPKPYFIGRTWVRIGVPLTPGMAYQTILTRTTLANVPKAKPFSSTWKSAFIKIKALT
jgi:hypothetical protein